VLTGRRLALDNPSEAVEGHCGGHNCDYFGERDAGLVLQDLVFSTGGGVVGPPLPKPNSRSLPATTWPTSKCRFTICPGATQDRYRQNPDVQARSSTRI
jgi:hypothetical protein